MIIRWKKIYTDIMLNILSVIFPLIILQLITLPIIAKELHSEDFGEILFLISIFTLISFPIGNVINNVKLLTYVEYNKRKIQGDFGLILTIFIGISVVFYYILATSFEFEAYHIYIIVIIILSILKEYFIVAFRIKLDYKGILINNLLLGVGYLFGTYLFIQGLNWKFIYIIGLSFSLIYIFGKIGYRYESLNTTVFFKKTFKDTVVLYVSVILRNILTHADRILMLPILGPTNVAIYYVASTLGKLGSTVVNPISTVILSYLVRDDKRTSNKLLNKVVIVSLLSAFFYFAILGITPFFLKIFYKELYESSLSLIPITTAIAIVNILSSLIHPYNLRYNKLYFQMIINSAYISVYIILVLVLTKKYLLMGFATGVLISSLFNLLLQVSVYLRYTKER